MMFELIRIVVSILGATIITALLFLTVYAVVKVIIDCMERREK